MQFSDTGEVGSVGRAVAAGEKVRKRRKSGRVVEKCIVVMIDGNRGESWMMVGFSTYGHGVGFIQVQLKIPGIPPSLAAMHPD